MLSPGAAPRAPLRGGSCYAGGMRSPLALFLLAGAALAGPRAPECVATSEKAVEIARTRGKLILLTVLVDHDNEARMVADQTFRDRSFLRVAEHFVVLYANNENDHGQRMVKDKKTGKRESRCADCPSIRCEDHMILAQSYARAFYPTSLARAPCHFVLDGDERVVEIIKAGDWKTGLQIVPAKRLVAQLKRLLKKHGEGLSEKEYEKLTGLLTDAKAARARGKTALELEKLQEALEFERKLPIRGVEQAKARIKELDAEAREKLDAAREHVEAERWEQALDALGKVAKDYPGTLAGAEAEREERALESRSDVKRLLRARDLYETGLKYLEDKRVDLARKRFIQCIRRYDGTKYAELAKQQLARIAEAD